MENKNSDLIIGYLQGHLSAVEKELFYTWVEESPSNKKIYFEVKAIYDASSALGKNTDMHASWERLLKKKVITHRLVFWKKLSGYAAVFLGAVVISSLYFLLFPEADANLSTVYKGGDGLKADVVVLSDGTQVSLGARTTFYCDNSFGKSTRTVYLEGEAFFKVAKQKDKPFIVKANGQDITALGTKFNVMAYPSDSMLITTLLDGSVEIATVNMKKHTILKPNEQLVYNRRTGTTELYKANANQISSWIDGYYYFPEQKLETILSRLNHVYGVEFRILSNNLSNSLFTGTFYRGQSIKDIMEIIHLSIPIQYTIDERKISISAVKTNY